MQFKSFVTIALLSEGAFAAQTVLRFGCSQIVVERLDPYVYLCHAIHTIEIQD